MNVPHDESPIESPRTRALVAVDRKCRRACGYALLRSFAGELPLVTGPAFVGQVSRPTPAAKVKIA